MFACLFTPDFAVQAALRLEPEEKRELLKQSPAAILDGPASLLRVMAINGAARVAGMEIGLTKLQAEACGHAWLRRRSLSQEESAQAALLDCASGFSPRVESTAAGTITLDLAGTEKLFGPAHNTAQKISLAAEKLGFDLNVAIASTPDTALYAARGFAGITVIEAGKEAERLGPLPLAVLAASPEILETFDIWGIRDFQSLAALPSIALVERLGQEGLQLQKLARGETKRVLVPTEPSQDCIESFEFDDPVETLESLTFILNRLLQQVSNRLASRSLAANELRVTLELEARQLDRYGEESRPQGLKPNSFEQKKELYERAWKLPLPVQDAKVLFRLAYLDLEANTQSAPIKKLTVQVLPVKPRFAQGGLFAPASPEAEQLEITLARIRSVTGVADENGVPCVGSPQVLDSHKPDSFAVQPFSAIAEKRMPAASVRPVVVLRRFRPALETSVEFAHDRPCSISLHKRRMRVLAASGPWRGSGHWWDATAGWARDEWDVALKTSEGVGYYRIYLDRIRKQWFVEGRLD
jgi:protein ImuB